MTLSPSFEDTPSVFWPADIHSRDGYCYGWSEPVICVAGVVDAHSEVDANAALGRIKNSNPEQFQSMCTTCGGEPILLGTCTFDKSVRRTNGIRVPELKLWFDTKVYILIFYHRHASDTLRFYSFDPLPLEGKRANNTAPSPYYDMAAHDFTLPKKPDHPKGLNEVVLNQFNYAQLLENMGQRAEYSKLLPRTAYVLLSLGSLASLIKKPMSILCQAVSVVGSIPVTPVLTLKDVSAIVQQLDVRVEQANFFASEIDSIKQRSMSDVPTYAARYTNFFNTVWLILNDLTIGFTFGTILCENRFYFTKLLNDAMEHVLLLWLKWALTWLDSWPAGLKLNTELSWFYSHTLIDMVDTWGRIINATLHYMPAIVYSVGIISCWTGATMAISVSMDILALISAHIYVCYYATRLVYRRMLLTAGSLWNLFRGKRYNVLRNRTDSWEYDIDQLLFGTILFTLLAFLFPTVLVYYSLFASLRLCTLLLQAGMDALLAFMNHFPLFALMLRLKDPWRLPGSIYFDVIQVKNRDPILVVENQPVSLAFIFFQYIELSSRLAKHYNPLRLFHRVLSGDYLSPIPRYSIRYNKMVQNEI